MEICLCEECKGSGKVFEELLIPQLNGSEVINTKKVICSNCKGSGRIVKFKIEKEISCAYENDDSYLKLIKVQQDIIDIIRKFESNINK